MREYIELEKMMDRLQIQMESNHHLKDPNSVLDTIELIASDDDQLCEDDCIFVEAALHAIENSMKWRVE